MKYISIVCMLLCMSVSYVGASYQELPFFDLYGQITNTSHGDSATEITFAVNTKQRETYTRADTIVIGCYDATHYDNRKQLVWQTTVNIQGISNTKAVYATVTIQKWTTDYHVMCHIDDTNIVPEINESNRIAWVTVAAKKWWTTPIAPSPKKPILPVVPAPPVVPTPICTIEKQEACSDVIHEPRGDKYMSSLWLEIPATLKSSISEYRIQWSNWSWSKRYTPGIDDIDRKTNCPVYGTYASQSATVAPPSNCARRVWSYFDDHVHQIRSCETTEQKVCELPPVAIVPPVVTPYPPKECKWDYCNLIPLPIVTPTPPEACVWDYCNLIPLPIVTPEPEDICIWRYCGKRLPPVSKRPPVSKPIIVNPPVIEAPIYIPPVADDDFSSCLWADCPWLWDKDENDFENRRIVNPQSINTEFEWLAWIL